MSQTTVPPRPAVPVDPAVPAVPVGSAATIALLRAALDEATSLLEADGGLVYLPDPSGTILRLLEDASFVADESRAAAANLRIPVGAGLFGIAFAERRVTETADYMADDGFRHDPGADAFVVAAGIRSMIVAPLVAGTSILGALGVFAARPGAFGERDRALVRALATHAATTLANTTLIDELEGSRAQLERRSERERTLRELVGSLAAIRDTDVLLQRVVAAATTVTGAQGAFLDRITPDGRLRSAYTESVDSPVARAMLEDVELEPPDGVMGRAVAERRVIRSDDYLVDTSFVHIPDSDALASELHIRSLVAAPLIADGELLGVLAAYSDQAAAFDDEATALVAAFADHAAVAVANAGLIEALEQSRTQLARRSERERALRELVGSLAAIRDTDTLLRRIAEAAVAVTGAKGVLVDRMEPVSPTHVAYTERAATSGSRTMLVSLEELASGGLMGRAVAERRVLRTDDYLEDPSFAHRPESDELARKQGLRCVVAAPLIADGEVLGVLAAYSDEPGAFDDEATALVTAFADHAAVAVANARLIGELERSREQLARRAAEEQAIRELAAQLTTIRTPEAVIEAAVEAVCRLADGEWAEVARIGPDGHIVWTNVYGLDDQELIDAQRALRLKVGEGLLGLAAAERRAVVTGDYLADPGFAHHAGNDAFARRARFRSLVAAPMVTDDEVVGILAVHSAVPDAFDAGHVALVSAFADVAAIAIGNARLIEALDRSESRYRGMLAASPDIVFTVNASGEFTFLSDTVQRQLGWTGPEMLGRHFSALIDVASMGDALERWRALQETPGVVLDARFMLIHQDGRRIPYEIRSFGLEEDGRFVGVQGSARDVSERERLERELRDSRERYRYLVKASPDVVWAVDTEGRFTFLSDRIEQLTGFRPEELIGHHFGELTEPEYLPPSMEVWAKAQADPSGVYPLSILMPQREGPPIPVDVWVTGDVRDGVFAGAHGSIRDLRERERLERELRDSEARYRYLVDYSPDIVWSSDADGRITYISETSEPLLGWRPDEIVGQHFSALIHPDSLPYVGAQYAASLGIAEPRDLRYRFEGRHRDGSRVPLEMHARTIVEDGVYRGVHGAVRDLRERERLERDLRRQAADLAAGEERAHLARELHDSVTQALFSMTLVTRSIELLLERDPAAAAARLETLRELQKDALAEMRALIFELRPASLETDGLVQALRTHSAAVEGRVGLGIVIEAEEEDERLPPEIEAALFRIAQEALNNVVKHAAATHVHIAVERDRGSACLTVTDDGAGFDVERVPDGHLGLAGMRARAEKLGGTFTVSSEPGRGTTITVGIPLADARVAEAP